MTIQHCSDLHIEFRDNARYLQEHPLQTGSDVLLLAGDIVPFAEMKKHKTFFDFLSDHYHTTYWLPGNHEYYGSDLAERSGCIHEKIRDNIFLVNNLAIEHESVRFIFSTLWSHISPVNQREIQRGMFDFHTIQYRSQPFTAHHYNEQHQHCRQFLTETLQQSAAGKTVVITHHIPTFLHYPERYRESILNEAFATELFELIENSHADYWIYGHHHQPVPAFKIGDTSLITNQLGYVKRKEHLAFNAGATLIW
ncbi:MAG TPA: metallophosphoesterase [Ohtaekwangia sp.]|uniref:metallophosphoesterase n=1 Tax=Ohtaekwangia sp. TaxID=2066019 RepID=UPI002F95ADB2